MEQSPTRDIDNKMLHLAFNKSVVRPDSIQKAITRASHDNGKYGAPDDVYNNHPACCLYRENEK